jgi:hypothetical protein
MLVPAHNRRKKTVGFMQNYPMGFGTVTFEQTKRSYGFGTITFEQTEWSYDFGTVTFEQTDQTKHNTSDKTSVVTLTSNYVTGHEK